MRMHDEVGVYLNTNIPHPETSDTGRRSAWDGLILIREAPDYLREQNCWDNALPWHTEQYMSEPLWDEAMENLRKQIQSTKKADLVERINGLGGEADSKKYKHELADQLFDVLTDMIDKDDVELFLVATMYEGG